MFSYYAQSETPKAGRPPTKVSTKKDAAKGKAMPKSAIKRKKVAEDLTPELEFEFSTSHPARDASLASESEPPVSRRLRSKASSSTSVSSPPKSRKGQKSSDSIVTGVSTKVPSKSRMMDEEEDEDEDEDKEKQDTRDIEAAKTPSTKKRKTTSSQENTNNNQSEVITNEPPSKKHKGTSKVETGVPADTEEAAGDSTYIVPPPHKRNTQTSGNKSTKFEIAAKTTTAASTSAKGKSRSSSARQQSSSSVTRVKLEENPVSYWYFVNRFRCEKILRSLMSSKKDGNQIFSQDTEVILRRVQTSFLQESERKFRPSDQYVHNPVNDGLLIAKLKHERIIKLLQLEHQALLASKKSLKKRLSDDDMNQSITFSSKTQPTPKSGAKGRKSKTALSSQPSASTSTVATSSTQSDLVASIIKDFPPAETLLTDEEKEFLAIQPVVPGTLSLVSFAHIQTKLDQLELVATQWDTLHAIFDGKSKESSAAMRQFMMPPSSGFDFSRLGNLQTTNP